ncbi:hypothetical protein Btru_017717 [Bulinus truncatus]|nr:hypothetical protein Btru_017717 [Bulinus truncatus]
MENIFAFNLFFLVLLNFFQIKTQAACTPGWFGSKCQYACHCRASSACDVNGQCPSQCASGWFGLGCQYQDLTTIPGATVTTLPTQTTTTWLTDGSDTTCNTDTKIQFVKISWNTTYPFTWLRLKVKDSVSKLNFIITFKTINNLTYTCIGLHIFDLDTTTVDYRCDLNKTVQELTVTGTGLKSLCSLYVSGGRNFALLQSATQSTLLSVEIPAIVAVDGNTNGSFLSYSCTHTARTDTNPQWTFSLDSAKLISRIVLYNRADCCSERLRNFKLETLDINNVTMWNYQDTRDTLQVYTVTSIQRNPVSRIRITATNVLNNEGVLTLCKVMVYGECVAGTWGLECSQTCPIECSTTCHQDSGSCLTCIDCNKGCEMGRWGIYCQNNCSASCYNKSCDEKTGVCDNGCDGFNDPPSCTKECVSGSWGPNCSLSCRSNCYSRTCDRITGICDNGCNGYMDPPNCLAECLNAKWGRNCGQSCNTKCKQQQCNRVTGLCDLICNSRTNSSCPSDCSIGHFCENAVAVKDSEASRMSFEAGIGIGIAVGVVAVIITVVVMVIVQRTRSKRNQLSSARRQGKQLESYDGVKQINEYNHSYETTGEPDTAHRSELKIHPNTSSYENSPNSVYETVGDNAL